ncbi:MAG: dihydrofolate reductase [Bacteroidetes bacterium]|nr:dihydrofolate reductase [Bacteroidota bacterium]
MKNLMLITFVGGLLLSSCNNAINSKKNTNVSDSVNIIYKLYENDNRFADIEILRYDVPGFEKLSLQQKTLVYYLSEAALCGRDIIYDQNNKYNLQLRKTLEEIYTNFEGDKTTQDFRRFEVFLKRIWTSNGVHHHYAENKISPEFSSNYLLALIKQSPKAKLPMQGLTAENFNNWLIDFIFNPKTEAKRVNKANGIDQIAESANNFYEGVSEEQVENYYGPKEAADSIDPISWGLNSKMVMENSELVEKTWKVGGMYNMAISKIVYWLEKALTVTETKEQNDALKLLIEFYRTGNLKTWDAYNIAWVKDVNSSIDVINGFIEVYHDAKGRRANFESLVEIKDMEASDRMKTLAQNAQWFETNSPIDAKYKKAKVTGITYNVVNAVMEGGDMSPSTAIGVNLPNAEWIREKHGSKSVSLGNIVDAYNKANSGGLLTEFCWNEEQVNRSKSYGQLAAKMHTAMHEVIGHASGQLNKGVTKGDTKQYGSTLEEARADLVALYYMLDPKLVELGLMPSLEVGKAEYDSYIRDGLMVQLRRVQAGENLEEDHMRNRQLVALWIYEAGKKENVIERKMRDGKTFFVINNYEKLRVLFGNLLNKIQDIKSTGNFTEAMNLVENFGVKVNTEIHNEVLKTAKELDVAAFRGFIQPKLTPIMNGDKIIDLKIDYTESFINQMLRYSKNYSYLPVKN